MEKFVDNKDIVCDLSSRDEGTLGFRNNAQEYQFKCICDYLCNKFIKDTNQPLWLPFLSLESM